MKSRVTCSPPLMVTFAIAILIGLSSRSLCVVFFDDHFLFFHSSCSLELGGGRKGMCGEGNHQLLSPECQSERSLSSNKNKVRPPKTLLP